MRITETFILLFGLLHATNSFTLKFADYKKCIKKNGKFPKPGSLCRSFYDCKGWKAVEMTCPEDQHFFPAWGYCVWPEEYPCLEKPKSEKCLFPNGRFLKPRTGCKEYYDCYKGVPTKKRCLSDLLFDHERGKCDYPELVSCPDDVTSTKRPSSQPTVTTYIITTDSEENSSEENSSSSEEHTKYTTVEDKSTSPSLSTLSSNSFDEKITTKIIFTSTKLLEGTQKTDLTTGDQYSELPITSPNYKSSFNTEVGTEPVITTSKSKTTTEDISTASVRKGDSTDDDIVDIHTQSEVIYEESSFTEPIENKDTFSTMTSDITESVAVTSAVETTTEDLSTASTKKSISINDSIEVTFPFSNIVSEIFFSTESIRDKDTVLTTIESDTTNSVTFTSAVKTVTESLLTVSDQKDVSTDNAMKETRTYSITINEEYSPSKPMVSKSTLTTTVPGITDSVTYDIFCPESDGYFPHPNDRSKYIACVAGIPIVMECPANLVYDHKKGSCEYE